MPPTTTVVQSGSNLDLRLYRNRVSQWYSAEGLVVSQSPWPETSSSICFCSMTSRSHWKSA